jgi:hypothetical protein
MSKGLRYIEVIPCYTRRGDLLARYTLTVRACHSQRAAHLWSDSRGGEVDQSQIDCVVVMVVNHRPILRMAFPVYSVALFRPGEEREQGYPILADNYRGPRNPLGAA